MTLRYGLTCVLCFAAAVPASYAQVLYGSLVGNVTDPSGAPVPQVEISITNTYTGQSRHTMANETGNYVFSNVISGTYALAASKTGFATFSASGIEVAMNSTMRVNVVLQIGAVTESIRVDASGPILQTDRAEVRHDIARKTLLSMPLPPGRNFQHTLVLVPGVSPLTNGNSEVANPARGLQSNVNGTSISSVNVKIDGTASNGIWLPENPVYIPALESIDVVDVVTNSFDAEQGLTGGAAINVQIKSGTNDLHGSAFEYHNNDHLKARNFFTTANADLPKTIYNQFGGTIGGPVKRDRLFYFLSFEGTYDRQGQQGNATLPTTAIRGGDMSGSTTAVYDPATGDETGANRVPFAGNLVPASRFDPAAAKLNAMLPDLTYSDRLTTNYFRSWPYGLDRRTLDTKVNWIPNEKLSLFGRFSFLNYNAFLQQVMGSMSGQRQSGNGFATSASFGATYVLSPRFVVDLNAGWNMLDSYSVQNRIDEQIGSSLLGIPGTNGGRKYQGGWPGFNISSYTLIGYNRGVIPIDWHDPSYQYSSNASYTLGSHNIRFGLELSRQHMNHVTHELSGLASSSTGSFTFSGGATVVKGGASPNQYNSYAAFLLGYTSAIDKILMVPDVVTSRAWQESLYIRDQWQVSPKLTVSYGVRWEYYPMPTRGDRGMEFYNLDTNQMTLCGVGDVSRGCGIDVGKKWFAPRFGIAYRAAGDLVVRTGYGITIDPYSLAKPLLRDYPVLIGYSASAANSYATAGLLKNGIPAMSAPDSGKTVLDVPLLYAVQSVGNQIRRGYIQSWNFTLQKKVPWGFTGEAGYVATRQIRQLGFLNMNAGTLGGGTASQPLYRKFGRSASTIFVGPVGNSHYDSLQTSLKRRFTGGYQLQVSYTWSKAIGVYGNDASEGLAAIPIPEYSGLNRSVTGYDRTHILRAAGVAELPFGKGKRWLSGSRALSALAGGWQVSSLFTSMTGPPFSVSSSATSLNAPGSTQRADQVKPEAAILGGVGTGQSWFDPLAFAPVTEARFGTAGFNSLRGPGTVTVDLGIFREFRLSERMRLQFRGEAFNATNTPHFGNPGSNASNMVLNGDGTIKSLGSYSVITSTRANATESGADERVIRFGLRFSF